MTASTQAGPASAPAEREVRPEFRGSAAEYFRVWIVNLLFTLLTLGIYSAWAKVRKKRYLYGNTRLDGDSFNYFASARAILKGRILAVVVFFVMFGIYIFNHPAGLTANVATTAANKGVLLALVAMAQTLPVLTGGLDLSVGMVFVLANCLASAVVVDTPSST